MTLGEETQCRQLKFSENVPIKVYSHIYKDLEHSPN